MSLICTRPFLLMSNTLPTAAAVPTWGRSAVMSAIVTANSPPDVTAPFTSPSR